jgi:TRAP-type C4-dicarboxylate transport system substrate-binding protein
LHSIQKTLWIGGYGPESSAHGQGLAAFRRVVESETDGEVGVRITWNIMDEGRPNTDLFELVETGEMFFCYFSSSYLGERVPELNVLETPFLFENLELAHRSLDGSLGEALRGAVRKSTGFEALGFWDNGFRHFTNRLHEVRSPTDCEGMTVRMQPNRIHEELIRSWGARPVAVELSEGIGLISRLEVDGQENPLANTVAYGVDQVHPYVTMTGHLYGARGLFAHRPTYETLASDLRVVVDAAVNAAVEIQRNAAGDLEKRLRFEMEEAGIDFVDLTEAERAVFVEAASPAIELAHNSVPRDLFDMVRS